MSYPKKFPARTSLIEFDFLNYFVDIYHMRKRILSLAFGMILLAIPCLAQKPRSSLYANFGFASPTHEYIDSGFESGFGFSLPLYKNFSLTLDISLWKSAVDEDQEAKDMLNGNLTVTPVFISVQYDFFPQKALTPFLFIGTEYIFTIFENHARSAIPEITLGQKIKSGFGFHAGGGIQVRVAESIDLFVKTAYLYRQTTGTIIMDYMNFGISTSDFSLDLSSLLFHIGIKYFF